MANNIGPELNTIQNGKYGSDIRMAIHDAIEKLNTAAERCHPVPVPYNDLCILGSASFTSTIPEGIAHQLYDSEASSEELLDNVWEFLALMNDDIFSDKDCEAEPGIAFDENGDSHTGVFIFDYGSAYEHPILGFTNTGCGVAYVMSSDASSISDWKFIGNLIASNSHWEIGYKTQYGAMILIKNETTDENTGIVLIGNTSDGEIGWVGKSADAYRHHSAVDAFVATTGDDPDDDTVRFSFISGGNETYDNISDNMTNSTLLIPVPTMNASFLTGIYAIPWGQHRESEGVITIGDRQFITNGYYALEI